MNDTFFIAALMAILAFAGLQPDDGEALHRSARLLERIEDKRVPRLQSGKVDVEAAGCAARCRRPLDSAVSSTMTAAQAASSA